MGKVYPELDQRLREFIASQPVFFVATAPCLSPGDSQGGHVNVSPKGYKDTFAVLGPATVAYLDLTGSGAETIAHLRQNGQITIMFCSFDRQPKILRLYGTGRVVLPGSSRWDELARHFSGAGADGSGADGSGAGYGSRRAIIVVDVHRIADSCGYAVPVMELIAERDALTRWAEGKSAEQLAAYRLEKNMVSVDGLPALEASPGAVTAGQPGAVTAGQPGAVTAGQPGAVTAGQPDAGAARLGGGLGAPLS